MKRLSVDRQIIRYMRQRQATCDEIEDRLGLLHQTASAAINRLTRYGIVARTGKTRATRSGRQANVLKVNR